MLTFTGSGDPEKSLYFEGEGLDLQLEGDIEEQNINTTVKQGNIMDIQFTVYFLKGFQEFDSVPYNIRDILDLRNCSTVLFISLYNLLDILQLPASFYHFFCKQFENSKQDYWARGLGVHSGNCSTISHKVNIYHGRY